MKKIFIILLTLLLQPVAHARIWTNTAGKQIEADLVSIDDSVEPMIITLRRSDGRQFTLLATTLSEADQEYLRSLLVLGQDPRLSISLVSSGVRLEWIETESKSWELQSAVQLNGTWLKLEVSPSTAGDRRVVEIPATSGSRFFRLIRN